MASLSLSSIASPPVSRSHFFSSRSFACHGYCYVPTHLHHSFIGVSSRLNPSHWILRCGSGSPGPVPSPPQPDPPPVKSSKRFSGTAATLSRFQDGMQIFFAVLVWMSLFFWASAWDGRNNNIGRNKGTRPRR
ncbi:hypothetical protein Nepgr_005470 [Nepenthes gracilis]|uniref:Uncharacterized protein n=1 Tax=Nepenthes gracilis TaxID=150966 RepID=A0AAD3XGM5_NEPGR|nr:hypothetical protein Nepgr_005470 [Nepenthes gracilis]